MSERTRRQAAIKRATQRAQQRMNDLDRRALRKLERIYRQARDDIETRIRAAADDAGLITLRALTSLRSRIDQHLEALSRARDELLDEGLQQSAELGVSPVTVAVAGARLSQIADAAVRQVRQFVDENGLQLSDRIWRLDRNAREAVARAVENGVVQGQSASRAAREFLERGAPVPADIRDKMSRAGAERLARQAGAALMVDDGNAYADARRVFRTELNRAHGLAYRDAAFEVDGAVGVRFLLSPAHPRRDICDMHAAVNRYGLGPGVYPKGKSPWPAHPNTLSYEEVVFEDEVTDSDRAGQQDRISWLKSQPPELQEAVLNSRSKRAALEKGLLQEGQIATPWRVLKDRYQRQGVDVGALKPEPIAARAFRRQGQSVSRAEAERYVLEEGRRGGVEYALVRDIGTGEELFRKTSQQKAAVYFSSHEASYFRDPARRLELVHNHPSSSSLSLPDLTLTTLPGVERVVAVGHDGSVYAGRALVDHAALERAYRKGSERVIARLRALVVSGELEADGANRVWAHVLNTVLARTGTLEYALERAGELTAPALNKLDLETLINDIAEDLR